MLKQMRLLRHWGRSAKQQDKTAAGRREASLLVGHRKTCGVHRRKRRQVLNGKQCHPDRHLTGRDEDFKVCADRAGKRVTAQVIQR
jgi:hypothetical protein